MAQFISDSIIDQISDKCDIAEIISSYIPLKRAGRNYKALCPFHHEKTPSFIVNPEKGIFHCFGCGIGGNVFSFIMKHERLEFPEVVRMLAKKTGVALPERNSRDSEESPSLINGMYRVHDLATAYFQNMLMSPVGKRVREYLAKRGIHSEIAGKFRLGFAPDAWDGLLNYLKKKGFTEELIEKSGLIIPKPDKSGYYDRFRNRLIFPIFNTRDKIIAFAGRVLDDSLPKYMNSPETKIYNKSRTLYGLNFAKKYINEKDAAVIVEGYTDLIIPHQNGMMNIIASCGTALTSEHIRILKRHSRNVITVYDSDKAGELATLRGLDLLLAEDMHIGVVRLPTGFDPDSYVRECGIKKFEELLSSPISLFEYKLNLLVSIHGTQSAESKTRIAGEMLKTINKINNEVLKSEYIKRLAESLSLNEDALRLEAKRVGRDYDGTYNVDTRPFKHEITPLSAADKIIIKLMMDDNNLIAFVKERLDCNEFCNKSSRRIVEFIFGLHGQNKSINYVTLISHFDIGGLENILSEIAASQYTFADKKRNLDDCILWIKRNNLKRNLDELHKQIKEAQGLGEQNRVRELVMQYNKLIKELPATAVTGLKIQT